MKRTSSITASAIAATVSSAIVTIASIMWMLHIWASTPEFEYCDGDFCAGSLQELDHLHAVERSKCAPYNCE